MRVFPAIVRAAFGPAALSSTHISGHAHALLERLWPLSGFHGHAPGPELVSPRRFKRSRGGGGSHRYSRPRRFTEVNPIAIISFAVRKKRRGACLLLLHLPPYHCPGRWLSRAPVPPIHGRPLARSHASPLCPAGGENSLGSFYSSARSPLFCYFFSFLSFPFLSIPFLSFPFLSFPFLLFPFLSFSFPFFLTPCPFPSAS
jgi:hypothetical protein